MTPCYLSTRSLCEQSLPLAAVLGWQICPSGLPPFSARSLSACLYSVHPLPLPRTPLTSPPSRLEIPSFKTPPNCDHALLKNSYHCVDSACLLNGGLRCWTLLCIPTVCQRTRHTVGPQIMWARKILDFGIRRTFLHVLTTSVHSPPLNTKTFLYRKSKTKVIHPSRFGSQPTSKRKSLGLFPAHKDLFKRIFTTITVCIFQLSIASFCNCLRRSLSCACRFVCRCLNASANSADAVTVSKMAASFGCRICMMMAPDKLRALSGLTLSYINLHRTAQTVLAPAGAQLDFAKRGHLVTPFSPMA